MGKNIEQDDNHSPRFHTGAPLGRRGGGGASKPIDRMQQNVYM